MNEQQTETRFTSGSVGATDSAGRKVRVDRQTVERWRAGELIETLHRYYYDHSHVGREDEGTLRVFATGEKLRLSEVDPYRR